MRDAPIPFAKGHGAGNDFIIVPDPDGLLALSPDDVRSLCHRRTGIGGDGLLRAVRCAADPESTSMSAQAEWFMDYRNSDGTNGAMCGNGIRVFARYLADTGLCQPGSVSIATRAGIRQVHIPPPAAQDTSITVDMGLPRLPGPADIEVVAGARRWSALHIDMGNPHAAVLVDDLAHAGDLNVAPTVTPSTAYPEGVTVEFVAINSSHSLSVRVHERGVGETFACGTGACAAVTALRRSQGHVGAGSYTVDFEGGRLQISVGADEAVQLTGPAVVILEGTVTLPRAEPLPGLGS
ncbi:diaminopimelate epimerase [Streptomyces erythrochromogenes]|uniref:diaminopimelate epimerase n=1 Tax=Streptomyces erythrochromogenes TaxID=285574 RepID=UPI00343541CC